jgi:hypothetical protein
MYLFIYLILYFFLVFFLRSYLLWKKTKVNPLTFNKGDDAHGYNGKVFGFISILELVVVAIYAFAPHEYQYLCIPPSNCILHMSLLHNDLCGRPIL